MSTPPAECLKLNSPTVHTTLPPPPAVLAIIWCSIVFYYVGGSVVLSKRTMLQPDQYIPFGRLDSFVLCRAHPRTLEFLQHQMESMSSEFGRYSDPFNFLHTLLCFRFNLKSIKLTFCPSIYIQYPMIAHNQKLKSLI